jgi:hypothetical protein
MACLKILEESVSFVDLFFFIKLKVMANDRG